MRKALRVRKDGNGFVKILCLVIIIKDMYDSMIQKSYYTYTYYLFMYVQSISLDIFSKLAVPIMENEYKWIKGTCYLELDRAAHFKRILALLYFVQVFSHTSIFSLSSTPAVTILRDKTFPRFHIDYVTYKVFPITRWWSRGSRKFLVYQQKCCILFLPSPRLT